jgi:signal peptidase
MIVLMVVVVFGFWYGCQFALNTHYPALAVVSESMLPTLNVGDIIIVQGMPASQIHANYTTGDIVVYRSPYESDKLIVHRAVYSENRGGVYWLTTKGDNNAGSDASFPETYLIGKVVARVPLVGNFVLFVNALGNFYYFVIIIIIIINILISFLLDTDEKKKPQGEEPHEKRKLFGVLDIETILFLILDVLLIVFLVFSLFGVFTFWQIGREPTPGYVTIRGMYSDLQYQATYSQVSEAYLSQGLFSYKIDCLVGEAVRPGVPTFSWMQATILVLLILNLWMANRHLHFVKKLRGALKT